ncbi:hypothetical protein RMATCC62417_10061 [Rhizopus microsporus]|nr:hypothetical protein RMATCC62417_10061 [Rhizopus microsporus]
MALSYSVIGEMKVTLYLVFFLLPVNVVSNYFFLEYLSLGYIGAALHIVFISAFITLLYTIYLTCITNLIQVYWPGLTLNAFAGWSEFLRLGIPGMLSLSTDWAFEVCALLTGVLGQTSLAAQSVVLTINTLLLMIPTIDAEDAIHDFNGKKVSGSRIVVERALGHRRRENRSREERNNRVVIKNLPPKTTWQEVKDFMRKAGRVTFADVLKDCDGEG